MKLITSLEQLDVDGTSGSRVRESLRAALTRAEKAETKLCKVRTWAERFRVSFLDGSESMPDPIGEETSPCPHEREVKKLTRWVDDLHSGMYINCVYCGHRYGPAEETPVSMAQVLKDHIEKCPKHPMSTLTTENTRLNRLFMELETAYNNRESISTKEGVFAWQTHIKDVFRRFHEGEE